MFSSALFCLSNRPVVYKSDDSLDFKIANGLSGEKAGSLLTEHMLPSKVEQMQHRPPQRSYSMLIGNEGQIGCLLSSV